MLRPDTFDLESLTLEPEASSHTHDPTRQRDRSRAMRFKLELERDVVCLNTIRTLTYEEGIPNDDGGIRAIVWKLLLNFLPENRNEWKEVEEKKKKIYFEFCRDLMIDISELSNASEGSSIGGADRPASIGSLPLGTVNTSSCKIKETKCSSIEDRKSSYALQRARISSEDHPLSVRDDSKWKRFFEDVEMKEQIQRDVDRTHPDLHFFSGDTAIASLRRESMKRALFVYAKLNPGISYVQGMNELFSVIFHTLSCDQEETNPDAIEAAAFWCFNDLLGEFRDNFCKQLDDSEAGIQAALSKFSTSLRHFDNQLALSLDEIGLKPHMYAFRWIATLLTQEFAFPDVVRLWDALLSDSDGRESCLQRLCLAMIILIRDDLRKLDFAESMKLLQQYPPIDVGRVIIKAEELKHYKTVLIVD